MLLKLLAPLGLLLVSGQELLIISSPADGSVQYTSETWLRGAFDGEIGAFLSPNDEVCWELMGEVVQSTIGACWQLNESKWRDVFVELPSRGSFSATLRVLRGGSDVILTSSTTRFSYTVEPECLAVMAARQEKQGTYRVFKTSDVLDSVTDEYVNFGFAPLCYGVTWHGGYKPEYSCTNSASRGVFGVDYAQQEFGHGDRTVLDFVLNRHRFARGDFVEVGTFGGVTSLYLGVAASLRGASLDTFDVVDVRKPNVVATWLPNMKFHLGDANARRPVSHIMDVALRNASVVLVDHADRLSFAAEIAAPRLQTDAVLLVHDFTAFAGPNNTLHSLWDDTLEPFGFFRVYDELKRSVCSSLAVYARRQ